MGESITFSGLTVIGALATVVVATFGLYQGLGPALAIGIAVALLANLTLLPALLAVLGRSVFWPRIPKVGPAHGAAPGGASPPRWWAGRCSPWSSAWSSSAAWPCRCWPTPRPASTTSPPPATSDSGRGQAILTADFPSAESDPTTVLFRLPASVWNDPSVLAEAQHGPGPAPGSSPR